MSGEAGPSTRSMRRPRNGNRGGGGEMSSPPSPLSGLVGTGTSSSSSTAASSSSTATKKSPRRQKKGAKLRREAAWRSGGEADGRPRPGRAEEILCNVVVATRVFKAQRELSAQLKLSRLVSRTISSAYAMRGLRELNIPDSEQDAQKVTSFLFSDAPRILKVKGAARLSEVEGFSALRHVELQLKEPREWPDFEAFLVRNRESLRTLVLFITEDLNVGRPGYSGLSRRFPREYLLNSGNLPNLRSLRIVHDFDAGKFNVDSEVFEALLRVPSPHSLRALAFADFDIRGETRAKAGQSPKLEAAMDKLSGLRVVVDPSLNMLRKHHSQWANTVHCLDIKLLDFGVTVPYVEPMAPRLTSFTIYLHLPRDTRAFVKLMGAMPNLHLLTLNVYFTNPELAQHWPHLDRAILPKLRHLKIFTFQELEGRQFSAWFSDTFFHSVRRLDVESALQSQDFQLNIRTPLKRLGVLLNNDEVDPDSFCVRLGPSEQLRSSLRLLTLDGPYAAFRNVDRSLFPSLEKVQLVWSKKGKEKIEDHLRWLQEEQKRIATRKRKLEQLLGASI